MDNHVFQILQEWHELLKSGIITEEEFIAKKKELLEGKKILSDSQNPISEEKADATITYNQEPSHEFQRKGPSVSNSEYDNSESPKGSDEWMKKNRTLLITLPLIIIILVVTYILFLKPDPVKDGEKAAKAFCNCAVKYDKAMIAAGNNFISSFGASNFATRQAALNQWQEIQEPINTDYRNCREVAQELEEKLSNRYISQDDQETKFESVFTNQGESCDSMNSSELNTLTSEIQSKIASIVVTLPTLNQIANDLESRNFQIWPYQGLYQLTSSDQWDIQTANQTDNSVDFIIDMSLPYPASNINIYHPGNSSYPVEILVSYVMSNGGWQFNYAKTLKIILDFSIPTGNWVPVPTEPNFSCTFNSRGNKYWVVDQGGEVYKGGPDVPSFHLNSNTLQFESREDTAFDMYFTYTPTN